MDKATAWLVANMLTQRTENTYYAVHESQRLGYVTESGSNWFVFRADESMRPVDDIPQSLREYIRSDPNGVRIPNERRR